MIQRRDLLIGATSCLAACATPDGVADLDVVLRNYARARGGVAALNAVRSTLNVCEIVEPTFTVNGRYIATTNGRMRVDVFYDGARAFSEGIDDEGAWSWPSDAAAPSPATPVARAALAHGIEFNLFGLQALPRRGHTLTLEGREEIAGIEYYKVKLRLAGGFETWRYVNPETWLPDRGRDLRALNPDVDTTQIPIETENMDFRAVSGVLTPFRWVQRNVQTNEELQHGTIRMLNYNVPADVLNFLRGAPVITPAP